MPTPAGTLTSVTYTDLIEQISTEGALDAARWWAGIATDAQVFTAVCVRRARRDGATWQAIADALGVTRSAAWQRFSGQCPDCGGTDGHEACGDSVTF